MHGVVTDGRTDRHATTAYIGALAWRRAVKSEVRWRSGLMWRNMWRLPVGVDVIVDVLNTADINHVTALTTIRSNCGTLGFFLSNNHRTWLL